MIKQQPLYTTGMLGKKTGIPHITLYQALKRGDIQGSYRAGCHELFTTKDMQSVIAWRDRQTN